MAEEVAEEVVEETQPAEVEAEEESKPEPQAEVKVEETEEKEVPEIPVRPTASYIIERQKRTIEKLRTKEEAEDPVAERLDRIEQLALGQADDRDLNSFFLEQPQARKYEKQIKAYMGHEAYKAAAPEVIYAYLSRNDRTAEAETKRKVADLEAAQTKSVGSGVRDTRSRDKKTAEDIKNMSEAEFREYDREQARLARS